MNALVGYTGFVGSNLYEKGNFDAVYNSKNIKDAYGLKPDLLVYAGLRAEKYLANQAPDKDMKLILEAEENIKKIAPKKLVLISTIDVFQNPIHVNEDAEINSEGLQAYGLNRYRLECWVREQYPDALIVRLPALFGKNLKKNFIYDLMHIIPSMLKTDKFFELSEKNAILKDFYEMQDNGFYKCRPLEKNECVILKEIFQSLNFSAVNFTDSRSVYQFYPLDRLWSDIQIALQHNILLWHPATEPLSAGEVYYYLTGNVFLNELNRTAMRYDYRTKYAQLFGGTGEYILDKEELLLKIKEFVYADN